MPDPAPEGHGLFSIYSWTDEVSKAGNSMWKIELQHVDDPEAYWRVRYYVVKNNSMTKANLDELMTSIGKPTVALSKLNPSDYIGDILEVQIEHEEFGDKQYAKAVKFIQNDGKPDNIGNQEPGVPSEPVKPILEQEVPF